jgi:putative transposase
MSEITSVKAWPHAPVHRLDGKGLYMVTSATLHKMKLFNNPEKLTLFENKLLQLAKAYQWRLEAWAVFVNHYHFITCDEAGSEAGGLKKLITQLHYETSNELNQLDQAKGRRNWYNFWDTKLTYEKSYLARLNYVHQNAVKHGLVNVANQYPWCAASWFERTAGLARVQTIYSFKIDQLKVFDDF